MPPNETNGKVPKDNPVVTIELIKRPKGEVISYKLIVVGASDEVVTSLFDAIDEIESVYGNSNKQQRRIP